MMGQPDAIIDTIGIFDDQDGDRKPRVLKRLAKDTGGEAFLPESLKDVVPICEQIARDIGNQYTIALVKFGFTRGWKQSRSLFFQLAQERRWRNCHIAHDWQIPILSFRFCAFPGVRLPSSGGCLRFRRSCQ
jgi:hypothetical protein